MFLFFFHRFSYKIDQSPEIKNAWWTPWSPGRRGRTTFGTCSATAFHSFQDESHAGQFLQGVGHFRGHQIETWWNLYVKYVKVVEGHIEDIFSTFWRRSLTVSAKLQLVLGTVPSSFFQAIQWSEGNGRMWVMIQTGTQGKQAKQWMLDDVKSLFLMPGVCCSWMPMYCDFWRPGTGRRWNKSFMTTTTTSWARRTHGELMWTHIDMCHTYSYRYIQTNIFV